MKNNYYNEIKNKLIDNEVYKKVKDYSKNRNDLSTYYEVGKLLYEAGNKYGEGIIKKYSERLVIEVGKKYNKRTLFRMRQFYNMIEIQKVSPVATQLTWSHYCELLPLKDINEINYYVKITIEQCLSKRQLRERISEKVLQNLILEDIPSFLDELGDGYSFIRNEYKIKIGDTYNYIDLLLFNIKYNCYVVGELKVTELKKEHIGQIEVYMNYIDKHIKTINQDKTIGIIITKRDNHYYIEYSSDKRILTREYILN
jgi:predicted nuclease of restriction endonuclease-like (RecB) superfamily